MGFDVLMACFWCDVVARHIALCSFINHERTCGSSRSRSGCFAKRVLSPSAAFVCSCFLS